MKDKKKELIIGVLAIVIIVIAAVTVAIILLTSKEQPLDSEKVKSLTLDQTSISEEIVSGQETVAVLTAIAKNITEELVWASSNEDVATVDASGETAVVTLKSAGSATITVKAGEIGALCQVAVKEVESKITLSPATLVEGIVKGQTKVVTLTATLENLEGNVEWTVDNDKVVSIVGNGETAELTLKGIGEAVVTAKVGDKTATCNVKVNDVTSMITLKTTSINKQIKRGSTATQTLEVTLLNVTGGLNWTSSNEKVAKVDKIDATKAKVTLVGAGNAVITVTDGTVKATCNVKVTYPTPKLTLNRTSASETIIAGEQKTIKNALTATLTNATGTINWTSSNTKVATVDKTGKTVSITAKKAGSATITATCKVDGVTYSAKCVLTVKEIKPGITLDRTSISGSIITGGTATVANPLVATLTSAGDAKIEWSSSNESVAQVTGNGKNGSVKLTGKGTAVITAKIVVNKIGYEAKCTVTVSETVPTITIDPKEIKGEIELNKTLTKRVTATLNVEGTVTWETSDSSIVSVSASGKTATLTLKKQGTADVKAKTVINGKTYEKTCKVTVSVLPTSIKVMVAPKEKVQFGQTNVVKISVVSLPAGQKVNWSVDNSSSKFTVEILEQNNTTLKYSIIPTFEGLTYSSEKIKVKAAVGNVTKEWDVLVVPPRILGLSRSNSNGVSIYNQVEFYASQENTDYLEREWIISGPSQNGYTVKSSSKDRLVLIFNVAGKWNVRWNCKYKGKVVVSDYIEFTVTDQAGI